MLTMKWPLLVITLIGAGAIVFYFEARREKAAIEELKPLLVRGDKKSCLENLATIERIKIDLVRQQKKKVGDVLTKADLDSNSGSGGFVQTCPSGGNYIINAIGKHAECSIPDHKLAADWKETDNLP
jgi:hypothetical protein